AAINATDDQLPLLAAGNNGHALRLLEQRELENGVEPSETRARMKELSRLFTSPEIAREAASDMVQAESGKKDQAAIKALLTKTNSRLGTAEERDALVNRKYQLAVERVKGIAGNRFR